MKARPATVNLNHSKTLDQARSLLEQARYKQALRLYDELLANPVSLIERLELLAERALGHALAKKPDAALEDAAAVLSTVRADTDDLHEREIDWAYELSEDIGHLAFLAEVYQLRGMLNLLRQDPRRAVEDLTLSLYMTASEAAGYLNYLQRACALIALGDCLDRACEDLVLAWSLDAPSVRAWLHLPDAGQFELRSKGVSFVHADGEILISADKARPRLNKLNAAWFRLSSRLAL